MYGPERWPHARVLMESVALLLRDVTWRTLPGLVPGEGPDLIVFWFIVRDLQNHPERWGASPPKFFDGWGPKDFIGFP